jgi:O-antigen/teichoic acid export membrane protein
LSVDLDATPPGAQVRLRYSSFINYALNLASAVFSVFFLIVVTRRLSIEDYGTWVMIWRYIGYFLIPSVIFSTWVTRDISRGKNTSITGMIASITFGVATIPFYLLVVIFLSGNLQQPLVPLLISSLILLLDYVAYGLNSISLGHAPQITGYSAFAYRVGSLLFGLIFVVSLSFGLTGAVIAALIGRVSMDVVSIILNRSLLRKSSFQPNLITAWIKSSWLPIFGSIAGLLVTFDVLVVSLVYDSQIPVAYYGVCVSIATFAAFAGVVTSSIYPKILYKKNIEDLKEAIWLISLLSLPIIFLMIIYAEPLSAILNLTYVVVVPSLRIMVFGMYFSLMSGLASTVYYGLDPFDEKKLESKMLRATSIYKGQRVSFILGAVYLLLLYAVSSMAIDYLPFVAIWVSALVSLYFISFLAFAILIQRHFSMTFPICSVAKDIVIFTIPAVASILPSILFPVRISESFYLTLYSLIPTALASMGIYFGILYLIEGRFRTTVKDVLMKISPKNKQDKG